MINPNVCLHSAERSSPQSPFPSSFLCNALVREVWMKPMMDAPLYI
jgi:hypothetical protein